MTTVLIIEDDPMIAEDLYGIVKKLGFTPYEPCYTAAEGLQWLRGKQKPSIVLLDINLDGEETGIVIGKKLNEEYGLPFIYVTSYSDPVTVKAAGQTEPMGYIVKPFTPAAIYSAIEIALTNHARKNKSSLAPFAIEKINQGLADPLSERELEVLEGIRAGKNNIEISAELFISVNTTKKHLKNIFEKLNVTSRTAAVAEASRRMAS